MARNLELQTNVVAPSADYPSGRIKNDTGVGDGTPVSEALYGDIQQFFAKMLRDASIAPNNSPDNTTNGFQLNEALIALMKSKSVVRNSNQTLLTGSFTTTELDVMSIVASADEDFTDVKITFSAGVGFSAPAGTRTATFKAYVNGVQVYTIGINGDTLYDESVSFSVAGNLYSAGQTIKITGKTSSGTCVIGSGSLIVEGINS